MRVIGYIRVSHREQGISGLSMEVQERRMRAYADAMEFELVGFAKDIKTAKDMRRPGLQAALKLLRKKKAKALLVMKLDRLVRSNEDFGVLLREYFNNKSGNDLIVMEESINTKTAAGRMVAYILVTISQWEREVISERTSAAMEQKKIRHEYTGGRIPYGYTVDNETGKLLENKEEAETLKLMHKLRTANGNTYRKIAEQLEENGIPSPGKSGHWHHKTIQRLLNKYEEEIGR